MGKFLEAEKNYILALAILFVIVSLSGTTYSLFLKADTTNTFNYNTGNLDLQFEEDKPITLETVFPTIDSEGEKQTPYKLTIKNTGTLTYSFNLKMFSETSENIIDSKYIKVKVNDNFPKTLYQLNSEIASNMIIYPGEEITFNISVWLDSSTPNSELGKTFTAKITATGTSVYKTLDSSGANRPLLKSNMLAVYYDETSKEWKKADSSNTIETYKWYDYDNSLWANSVTIKDSSKKIYDISGNNDINIENVNYDNDNIILDDNSLDIGLSNYQYENISTIIRLKVNDLKQNKIYIITNNQISYYYDNQTKKFIFKNGNKTVSSNTFELEENKWYILGYTYNNSKVSFYINGNLLSTNYINGIIKSNNTFKISTDDTNKETSYITVGDIYIYKDILSSEEIATNYATSINIIYDNLACGYNSFTPQTRYEYYLSREVGTTINDDDITLQYVWIPRFKYKVWNVTGEDNIDSYDAKNKGIEIVFEKDTESSGTIYCKDNNCYSDELLITKVTQNDNGKYYTHPAFTNLSVETTGLWVSKYEVSTTNESCLNDISSCLSNTLEISSKKGNQVWRNNYLSNYYQAIKKIDNNASYHMIKNTEWGAITYLSHSKYGTCQNNTCQKEVGNDTFISGSNINDSTTNNITGVFDMIGSTAEFTMANYADQNKEISLNNSHFQNIPISNNEYDLYYENTFILGDATKEFSSSQTNTFVDETNNWMIRGGIAKQTIKSIFNYSATTDNNSEYISTRIVTK